jgi:serine O-acetyltransferase
MPSLARSLIRKVGRELDEALSAAKSRDPAARGVSRLEILATYAGVQALLAHRVAHRLHEVGVPIAPRLIAYVTQVATGIEIHPAARIGQSLFIDHGSGVVIGETAEIGDDVTLYQGVTLGGAGSAHGKRHPILEESVVVGAGARLLGPIRVGRFAKIGANTVVIHDVPENSTVVGNPGHPVRINGKRTAGPDADWSHLPDPVADAIKRLAVRVRALEAELDDSVGLDPRVVAVPSIDPGTRPYDPAGG